MQSSSDYKHTNDLHTAAIHRAQSNPSTSASLNGARIARGSTTSALRPIPNVSQAQSHIASTQQPLLAATHCTDGPNTATLHPSQNRLINKAPVPRSTLNSISSLTSKPLTPSAMDRCRQLFTDARRETSHPSHLKHLPSPILIQQDPSILLFDPQVAEADTMLLDMTLSEQPSILSESILCVNNRAMRNEESIRLEHDPIEKDM